MVKAKASYYKLLSKKQRLWYFIATFLALAIVGVGFFLQPKEKKIPAHRFKRSMTIRQVAPLLEVTGRAIARELKLPLNVSKDTPIAKLGVSEAKFRKMVHHLQGHHSNTLKYYVYLALVLWGLIFLLFLGRPENSTIRQRRVWYPRAPYVVVLIIAVLVAGFLLGKSPNPMEGAVKVFKATVGLYPSILKKVFLLMFFLFLAVIGNKLICGWACPFGALQELIFSIPGLKRYRNIKLPFVVTNSIRGGLFVLMILMLFGLIGPKKGYVLYHTINPFNLFNFDIEHPLMWAVIIGSLFIGFFFYRPFCQFICPFGFVSWLFERVSIFGVRIDHEKCIKCNACAHACPLNAAQHRIYEQSFASDCFSCGRCLSVCPTDAIQYRAVLPFSELTKKSKKNDEK